VSPRVLELKAELLPPDAADVPPLEAFADPAFRAPDLLAPERETALRETLGEPIPFDEAAPFDLQSAAAVDAAVEEAFLPDDAPARNAWGRTISVYPLRTRSELLHFGAAAVFFLAAAVLFNSSGSRRFLWRTVAMNGLTVALFCLAGRANPDIFKNELVAALRPENVEVGRGYGMFVNKNNAAGYLVLCLAAAIGPVVSAFLRTARSLEKERAERKRERAAEKKRGRDAYETRREAAWKRILGDLFDLFDRRFVSWACVAGMIFAAILASLSRGGAVASLVALTAVLAVLAVRKEGRLYWPAVAATAAVALGLVAWTGLAQRVDARMATLVEEDAETGETAVESDARWANWEGAALTRRDYPWFGSGLGTYYLANYRNDEALRFGGLFYYAENSWIQTRLETGRVGAFLFVATYLSLLFFVGRLLVGRRSLDTLAVGCVGLCLIIGQFLASMGDFGIYLPSNLLLFAALGGSCVARKDARRWEKLEAAQANASNSAARERAVREIRRSTRREFFGATALSALLLAGLLGGRWALAENADAVERDRLLTEATIPDVEIPRLSVESLAERIAALRSFVERRDDSYEVRAKIAYLELLKFRTRYMEPLRDAEPTLTDEILWERTHPIYWAAELRRYRRAGLEKAAAAIRSNEAIVESFPRILAEWTAARRICPLETAAHLKIVEALAPATPIVWEREREAVELAARQVAASAPFDARLLFNAGRELLRVDLETLWPRFWRLSVENSTLRWAEILNAVELGVPRSKQAGIVAEITPNNVRTARSGLSKYYGKRADSPIYDALKTRCAELLEATPEVERDAAFYADRALFNKYNEDYEAAEADFRKALEFRPGSVGIELQLAILLCEQTRLLQKDEECVKLLRRIRGISSGNLRRRAESWLKRAERNLAKGQARAEMAEKERRGESGESSESINSEKSEDSAQ
ncbi:MAG: O-antigen ligase family protein, partial [Thermoguttaceae bacterium]|nr:O-antigen ligase family protein [Thermoguttaceae bacterium]